MIVRDLMHALDKFPQDAEVSVYFEDGTGPSSGHYTLDYVELDIDDDVLLRCAGDTK